MDSENRPIFQTAPRRCGRTEAMLNRVIESLRGIGVNNPDLSLWRIVCANTEHAKNDIFPRLLKKLDNVGKIKYRWHTDSSERILLEIEPYGPRILILATANLDHRRTAKTFYDHAATEWHLREALWQLKEDSEATPHFKRYAGAFARGGVNAAKAFKEEYFGEWPSEINWTKDDGDGKTNDKDKKND